MNMLLEVIAVPVTDTDAAKGFYADKLGFHVDMDVRVNESMRFVQLTPPGSNCSIHIGEGLTAMKPGSLSGLVLVVDSIEAAQAELTNKSVKLSDIDEYDWGRQLYFSDLDGNGWTLQESFARNKQK